MTYIEKDFPSEWLNQIALAEGNSKKPVYQMHKWWARRLGCILRMILLGCFEPSHLSALEIRRHFLSGLDLQGKIVLDPFMGGGTTLVEALRLGCKVIGIDINPVAWFITKKEIEPVNLEDLERAFRHLDATVGEKIRQYYRTKCPCGRTAEVMYYFWVKVAECLGCGHQVSLFPNYELSRGQRRLVSICPQCESIVTGESLKRASHCEDCGYEFDPYAGIASQGKFRCPQCGLVQKVLDVIETRRRPLELRLFALEAYCRACGRFFKKADKGDLVLWKKAQRDYLQARDRLLIPHSPIPTQGRSDPRPVNHGYKYFHEMFNERQLLCLSHLLQGILAIGDRNIREFLLLAFSDCIEANNMFCKYETRWHKVSVFFGLHAYHPIERPTENNVWGTQFGRGTFARCYRKLRRAKMFCARPYERVFDREGKRISIDIPCERVEAHVVEDFDALAKGYGNAILRCASSERMDFIPDRSVDVIITDPPYFDNIQYSELADFFYVWLRLGLSKMYPWFRPEYSARPGEIVQNRKANKHAEDFANDLETVFRECHRVLKDDGLFVFTFHHAKPWAWKLLAKVILSTRFYVSASPIVRSEGKSGFHSSRGNIRYDAILVCRKQPSNSGERRWQRVWNCIERDSLYWIEKTHKSGMELSSIDVTAIVFAKAVEYWTKAEGLVQRDSEYVEIDEMFHAACLLAKELALLEWDRQKFNKSAAKQHRWEADLFSDLDP
jgi:putative DNA methylase